MKAINKKCSKLQYKVLKFVYNDHNSSYQELLIKGGHLSIFVHLMHTMEIEVYKCVNGVAQNN